MRSALTVLLLLASAGGAALAQAPAPALAPALSGHAAAGVGQAPKGASASAKAAKGERNGRARRVAVADRRQDRQRGPSTVEEALTSCLALWEPATHMSKAEWARACRRVAERLRGTTG